MFLDKYVFIVKPVITFIVITVILLRGMQNHSPHRFCFVKKTSSAGLVCFLYVSAVLLADGCVQICQPQTA